MQEVRAEAQFGSHTKIDSFCDFRDIENNTN